MQDEVLKVLRNSLEKSTHPVSRAGSGDGEEKDLQGHQLTSVIMSYVCPYLGAGYEMETMLQIQGSYPMTSDIYLIPPTRPHCLSLAFPKEPPLTTISELVGLSHDTLEKWQKPGWRWQTDTLRWAHLFHSGLKGSSQLTTDT